jgi:hypothetical protein
MALFILTRAALLDASQGNPACAPGIAQHEARALEQAGVDFGGGVIGNGVDTYYPDGFTDAEWIRVAGTSAAHAKWLLVNIGRLGLPKPSLATFKQIAALRVQQRKAGA